MEREVLLTGIGGQGVQLAARTLAVAAVHDRREVMVFGTYGGSMRGGNTDATLVIGDQPLTTPPTIDHAWSAIAMHHEYWPDMRDRVIRGGLVVIDSSVFRGEVGLPDATVLEVEATRIATDLGNARSASMVALGAFAAASRLVGLEALVTSAYEVLPSYRTQHADANALALRTGWEQVPTCIGPAWLSDAEVVAP